MMCEGAKAKIRATTAGELHPAANAAHCEK
jgi:hypothetical protein